jgi:hypothetical protein
VHPTSPGDSYLPGAEVGVRTGFTGLPWLGQARAHQLR